MKKDQNSQTKSITVTIFQENHFLITITPLDNNHRTDITFVEDLQIKEIHKISDKIDIVDQTVKTISIKNNYSRSNSKRSNYSNYNRRRSNSNPRNRYYSNDHS